jgi:hypothetical protein
MMSIPLSSLQSVIPHGQFTRPSLHSSLYSPIVFPHSLLSALFLLPIPAPLVSPVSPLSSHSKAVDHPEELH